MHLDRTEPVAQMRVSVGGVMIQAGNVSVS
jgi:hypothetical protein